MGVVHHITCPHTSEQNGMVESRLRRVVECAMSLLLQGSVPIQYWSYACQLLFIYKTGFLLKSQIMSFPMRLCNTRV